jgi:hypothetical protein
MAKSGEEPPSLFYFDVCMNGIAAKNDKRVFPEYVLNNTSSANPTVGATRREEYLANIHMGRPPSSGILFYY